MKSAAVFVVFFLASSHFVPVPMPMPIPVMVPVPLPIPVPIPQAAAPIPRNLPVPVPVPVLVAAPPPQSETTNPSQAILRAPGGPAKKVIPVPVGGKTHYGGAGDCCPCPAPGPLAIRHPAAIKVNSKQWDFFNTEVSLKSDDEEGFPIYASEDGSIYFCHEEFGWSARKDSCQGDYLWTSTSKEEELAAVNPKEGNQNSMIDSFEVRGSAPGPFVPAPSPVVPVPPFVPAPPPRPFVPVAPPSDDGPRPKAIVVKSKFGNVPPFVELKDEEAGYPTYASENGDHYFCHESWGWTLRKDGSCAGSIFWTSTSTAQELIDVDPTMGYEEDPNRMIDAFERGVDYSVATDPKYGANLFTDPDFPPEDRLLPMDDLERPGQAGGKAVEWIRVLDLNRAEDEMLFDSIDFTDPTQGAIGDCWMIASMSVAALNHADQLKELFKQKHVSPDGRYDIKLWDVTQGAAGEWRTVTIDDWIASKPRSKYEKLGEPLFAHGNNNEIWPMILEKAFAKFLGGWGWAKGKGGMGIFAWQAFGICSSTSVLFNMVGSTGKWNLMREDLSAERQRIFSMDKDDYNVQTAATPLTFVESLTPDQVWSQLVGMWNILADADCCVSETEVPGIKDELREIGPEGSNQLVGGHAYGLLNALEVQTSDGERVQLVRIRNPYGNAMQWRGDWGRDSPKWDQHPEAYQQILQALGGDDRHAEDDGIFWMTFEKFQHFYFAIDLCDFVPHGAEMGRTEL